MARVALLGDSVFDNGEYLEREEDSVPNQLSEVLGEGYRVDVPATDGHFVKDVPSQLDEVLDSVTHLVLSIGGDDALQFFSVLDGFEQETETIGTALQDLAGLCEQFELEYRRMLDQVLELGRPTILCTIYEGDFPEIQTMINTGLPILNDVILSVASDHGLPVIDLNHLCDRTADYATSIEPSPQGGEKITSMIDEVVKNHDFSSTQTTLYATRK